MLVFEQRGSDRDIVHDDDHQRLLDSAPFIAFMLPMILDAVTASAPPPVAPQVTPQVGELLAAIRDEMGREALQSALNLSDRKSFRERYIKPALDDGLMEMTLPDKPNSLSPDRQRPPVAGAALFSLTSHPLSPKGTACGSSAGSLFLWHDDRGAPT